MTGKATFRTGMSDALVDAWVRSVPGDPVSVDRFRRMVLLDPNFDPDGLRVALDGDRVVGAAYAVGRQVAMVGDDLEPTQGWIPFFYVDPEYRRRGIGSGLLREAIDWLGTKGRQRVDFASYTPNYFVPGLDRKRYPEATAMLESHGFRTLYRAHAMDMSLVDYQWPEDVTARWEQRVAEGYSFSDPTPDELAPLIRLAGEHFNPDWGRAIREAALAGTPLDRIVVARDPHGRIVGWGMCGAYDGVIDRFGPFGVRTDLRGLGLGEILLHLCLRRMVALGAHNAWFLWTSETSPAGRLYLKTGFRTTRVFDVLRAELGSAGAS